MHVEDEVRSGIVRVGDFGEGGAGAVGYECLGGGVAKEEEIELAMK